MAVAGVPEVCVMKVRRLWSLPYPTAAVMLC